MRVWVLVDAWGYVCKWVRMCILIARNVYLLNCIKGGEIVFPNIFSRAEHMLLFSVLFAYIYVVCTVRDVYV